MGQLVQEESYGFGWNFTCPACSHTVEECVLQTQANQDAPDIVCDLEGTVPFIHAFKQQEAFLKTKNGQEVRATVAHMKDLSPSHSR